MTMLTVAISGMPGAGSSTVGKLLAVKLKINHFSPGQFFKDISLGKIKNNEYYNLFKHLCESNNIEIPEIITNDRARAGVSLWNTEFGKSKKFHEVLDELQREIAKKKGVVIDGKLSLRMLHDSDLKVWIKANLQKRAERITKREGINIEDAKNNIIEREQREREEWKRIYGFDYFDQEKDADIIIDSSNMFPKEAVKIILGNKIIDEEMKKDKL